MGWFKSKAEKLRDKIELEDLKKQWEMVKPQKHKSKPKTVIEYNENEYRDYLQKRIYKGKP